MAWPLAFAQVREMHLSGNFELPKLHAFVWWWIEALVLLLNYPAARSMLEGSVEHPFANKRMLFTYRKSPTAICASISCVYLSQPCVQARVLSEENADAQDIEVLAADTSDMLVGIGNATWTGTPRIISWNPMAVVFENFLSVEECDYILKRAKPRMEPAMLVNSKEQRHQRSKSRTSHGAFFDSFEDDVLAMITNRIAHVAKVPPGMVPIICHCT